MFFTEDGIWLFTLLFCARHTNFCKPHKSILFFVVDIIFLLLFSFLYVVDSGLEMVHEKLFSCLSNWIDAIWHLKIVFWEIFHINLNKQKFEIYCHKSMTVLILKFKYLYFCYCFLIIVAGIHGWNEWRLKVTIWTFWLKCIKFTSRSRVFSIIIFIFLVLCLTRTINYLIKCTQEKMKEDAFLMTMMMMMMQFDIVIDVFVASFYVHTNKLSFMKHIPT